MGCRSNTEGAWLGAVIPSVSSVGLGMMGGIQPLGIDRGARASSTCVVRTIRCCELLLQHLVVVFLAWCRFPASSSLVVVVRRSYSWRGPGHRTTRWRERSPRHHRFVVRLGGWLGVFCTTVAHSGFGGVGRVNVEGTQRCTPYFFIIFLYFT